MVGLAVLVGYVVCKGTVIAIEKYGRWKGERDEFQAWKQARADGTAIKRVGQAGRRTRDGDRARPGD